MNSSVTYMKYKETSYEVTLAVNNDSLVLGSRLVKSVLSDHVQFSPSHSRVIALKALLGWFCTQVTQDITHACTCKIACNI